MDRQYHDQEQTPHAPDGGSPSRVKQGDWFIYNNTNDVSGCHPGWKTIISGGKQASWEGCRDAADAAGKKGFTFWHSDSNVSNTVCWLVDDWHTVTPQNYTMPGAEKLHVSGYKPSSGETPPRGECGCLPFAPVLRLLGEVEATGAFSL